MGKKSKSWENVVFVVLFINNKIKHSLFFFDRIPFFYVQAEKKTTKKKKEKRRII